MRHYPKPKVSEKFQPTLHKLLKEKKVFWNFSSGGFQGYDSDGVRISFGDVPEGIERYLKHNPSPSDWSPKVRFCYGCREETVWREKETFQNTAIGHPDFLGDKYTTGEDIPKGATVSMTGPIKKIIVAYCTECGRETR